MWFSETTMRCTEGGVEILAATDFATRWIEQRFATVIRDAAHEAFGKSTTVRINTQQQPEAIEHLPTQIPQQTKSSSRPTRQLRGFDDFVVGSSNRLAWSAAKQLAGDEGKSISPLFIHGVCGVGKTHLLQALCKEASKTARGRVRFVTAEQFTNEFIASSRTGDFQRFRKRS